MLQAQLRSARAGPNIIKAASFHDCSVCVHVAPACIRTAWQLLTTARARSALALLRGARRAAEAPARRGARRI